MKLHQDETANRCNSKTRETSHNKTHGNLNGYGCLKKLNNSFENAASPLSKTNKMVNRITHKEGGSVHKKYLKPGALSRLRDSRVNARGGGSSSSLWCKALGRKRVLLLTSPRLAMDCERKKPPSDPTTPKMPTLDLSLDLEDEGMRRESRLESLPLDLLVRILCHLHHDELGALAHVSMRIRKAVMIAKRFHFNYTTPDHNRQDLVRRSGMGRVITPKAPKHGPRPPGRLSLAEMRQIAASLFQGSSSSALNRSKAYKSSSVHEEELCHAVSQNSIQ